MTPVVASSATTVQRMPRRAAVALIAATLAVAVVALAAAPGGADAAPVESCPGSGAGPCPYAAVQVIGARAEGILRFPEAVAVDSTGNVYVADQLSYVVQKFTAAGVFESAWGSYGAGPGQFGPIGGLATDAAGDVYVVDSSHDRIEKFNPAGEFVTAWGKRGSALGDFAFGSSQNPSQPPGGGIAVSGQHVYVADSGNDRVERFNLEGGEPFAWGSYGSGPGQFSYPRGVAANESEVIVSDDDNHRIEKFSPEGTFEAQTGAAGDGPGDFGFPYGVALDGAGNIYVADDSNDRVVKLSPQLTFAGAWGGVGAKPGQLDFPRALASDPAGDTYVADTANERVEVFDPVGNYLRTLGAPARGPGELTSPRGLAVDPSGRLLVSDTVDQRIEAFAPGSDAYLTQWTLAGGHASGFSSPSGIGIDPRGSVYVADTGNSRLVRLWGDGTFLGELGGPADLGGAQLADAGSVAVAPATGLLYVADSAHNRLLVYGPEGTLQAKWGAGEGNGAAGSAPGAFNHPDAVAVAPSGDVYVADTGNDRVVELLSRRRRDRRMGLAGDCRRTLSLADRHRRRRRRTRVRGGQRKQPGPGVRSRRARAGEVGAARHRPRRVLAAERGRRRLRWRSVRRRHEQQPRRALRPHVPGRGRLSRARHLAGAAERRAGARSQPAAARRRARPPCTRVAGELQAQLQDPRDGLVVGARRPPRCAPARGRPRAARGGRGPRAPADRPAVASAAAAPARRAPAADGARHDRGRRTDRTEDDFHAQLHGQSLSIDNERMSIDERAEEGEPPGFDQRTERIRIETDRHRIEGMLTLARDGYRSRVSDVLNASERDFITLTEVTVAPLDGGPIELHPYLSLARRHIVFAVAAGDDAQ